MKPGFTIISQDQITFLVDKLIYLERVIGELNEKVTNIDHLDKWLTIKETSKVLKVGEAQIRNYAKAGLLTKHYIGEGDKLLRFDRDEVLELPKKLNVPLLRKRS